MQKGVVVRHIERADADAVKKLGAIGVATVHEAQGRVGLMKPYMRPVYPGAAAAGTAVTVLVPPGDNWMIHVAVEMCQPGDVMVIAPTSTCTDGYFGELLASSLTAKGVKGLVIEAGVRDVRELQEMNFPVWSRAVSAQGTVKETLGSVNVPLVCAGQQVFPGDALIADDDGIVVVGRIEVASVVAAAEQRVAKENATRARLQKGELGIDIYGMRERLAEKGLVYVDTIDMLEKHTERK